MLRKMLLSAITGFAILFSSSSVGAVEIEYWQYTYKTRVEAIDKLIISFEAKNPGIKVKHTNFPYADYRKKVAIAVSAGDGPDLVQLYYGWLNDYRESGLIKPLPKSAFPHSKIENEFFGMVKSMKADGEYWGFLQQFDHLPFSIIKTFLPKQEFQDLPKLWMILLMQQRK